MGKEEIARYEQFLFFPRCFQKKLVLQTRKNQGLFGRALTLYLEEKRNKLQFLKRSFNPLPDKPILCSSNLASNEDMV